MAAVSAYSDLYAAIAGRLPARPDATTMLQACQWVAREFLKDTGAWGEKLDAIDVVAEDDTYDITPSVDATYDIHRIVGVWLLTAADVTSGNDGAEQDLALCKFDPSTDVLTLPGKLAAAVTDGLVVKVVKVPHYNATALSAWVLNRYFDALVSGTVQYLAKQRNRPWFDPDMAREAGRELANERARAANDALTEFRGVTPVHRSGLCAFIGS